MRKMQGVMDINGKRGFTGRTGLRWLRCIILIAISFVFGIPMQVQAANPPGLDAAVNKKNIMRLLNKYDADGAFLLKSTESKLDYMVWFSRDERITERLVTAVHEQCHAYTFTMVGTNEERIYVGDKKSILVPYTQIFDSKKMAKTIPKKCRTYRYNTYIAKPVENLASNVDGIYGILNEFNAYCWGMNSIIALYNYYDRYKTNMDTWGYFIGVGASERVAYCEFKYYTLHYLYYAKVHEPDVYEGIMKNENFRKAYQKTEQRFAKLIKTYEKDLKKIAASARKAGYRVTLSEDSFMIDDHGSGLQYADYSVLRNELNKKRYKDIHNALIKK